MEFDRHKRILIPLLTLVVVVVWGHTGMRFFRQLKDNEGTMPQKLNADSGWQGIDSSWFSWTFPKSLRDPFSLGSISVRATVQRKKMMPKAARQTSVEPKKPEIRLCGLVGTDAWRVAIIECPDGHTYKVRTGDQIDSMIVEQIEEKRLNIRCHEQIYHYPLDE